jgi:hypothetical protein
MVVFCHNIWGKNPRRRKRRKMGPMFPIGIVTLNNQSLHSELATASMKCRSYNFFSNFQIMALG